MSRWNVPSGSWHCRFLDEQRFLHVLEDVHFLRRSLDRLPRLERQWSRPGASHKPCPMRVEDCCTGTSSLSWATANPVASPHGTAHAAPPPNPIDSQRTPPASNVGHRLSDCGSLRIRSSFLRIDPCIGSTGMVGFDATFSGLTNQREYPTAKQQQQGVHRSKVTVPNFAAVPCALLTGRDSRAL